MTERHFSHLDSYLSGLLGELALSDWRLILSRTPCEEGSYATIRPTYGQRLAVLHVSADFDEVAEERATKALVHELVHCHFAPVQHQADDDGFVRQVGESAHTLWMVGFRLGLETAIDSVALLIAPHVTQLRWPEVGSSRKRR